MSKESLKRRYIIKRKGWIHSQLNKVFTANPYDYITPEVHFPEASTGFNTNMSDTYKETMKDFLLDLHFQGMEI